MGFFSRKSDPTPSWNDIPFDSDATPEQKADEFGRQWRENKAEGDRKEKSGEYRPEANGRGSHA